jgi:hypothetical protein
MWFKIKAKSRLSTMAFCQQRERVWLVFHFVAFDHSAHPSGKVKSKTKRMNADIELMVS